MRAALSQAVPIVATVAATVPVARVRAAAIGDPNALPFLGSLDG